MPASYFLGTRLLAANAPASWWDDTQLDHVSLVFICPTCGDAWGRILNQGCEWLPMRRGCAKHPWLDEVGGSFIAPWRRGCPRELPPEVLRYELFIRLDKLQGENQL